MDIRSLKRLNITIPKVLLPVCIQVRDSINMINIKVDFYFKSVWEQGWECDGNGKMITWA